MSTENEKRGCSCHRAAPQEQANRHHDTTRETVERLIAELRAMGLPATTADWLYGAADDEGLHHE